MSHTCHATGCTVEVPPEMFMCKKHWYSLPHALRKKIWATYRPGQCDDWRISHAYAEAARECVRFIAAKEGREPDTKVYDMLDPGPRKRVVTCCKCGKPSDRGMIQVCRACSDTPLFAAAEGGAE